MNELICENRLHFDGIYLPCAQQLKQNIIQINRIYRLKGYFNRLKFSQFAFFIFLLKWFFLVVVNEYGKKCLRKRGEKQNNIKETNKSLKTVRELLAEPIEKHNILDCLKGIAFSKYISNYERFYSIYGSTSNEHSVVALQNNWIHCVFVCV